MRKKNGIKKNYAFTNESTYFGNIKLVIRFKK